MSGSAEDNPWRMYKCLSCGEAVLKRDKDEKVCDLCGGELMRKSEYMRKYGNSEDKK